MNHWNCLRICRLNRVTHRKEKKPSSNDLPLMTPQRSHPNSPTSTSPANPPPTAATATVIDRPVSTAQYRHHATGCCKPSTSPSSSTSSSSSSSNSNSARRSAPPVGSPPVTSSVDHVTSGGSTAVADNDDDTYIPLEECYSGAQQQQQEPSTPPPQIVPRAVQTPCTPTTSASCRHQSPPSLLDVVPPSPCRSTCPKLAARRPTDYGGVNRPLQCSTDSLDELSFPPPPPPPPTSQPHSFSASSCHDWSSASSYGQQSRELGRQTSHRCHQQQQHQHSHRLSPGTPPTNNYYYNGLGACVDGVANPGFVHSDSIQHTRSEADVVDGSDVSHRHCCVDTDRCTDHQTAPTINCVGRPAAAATSHSEIPPPPFIPTRFPSSAAAASGGCSPAVPRRILKDSDGERLSSISQRGGGQRPSMTSPMAARRIDHNSPSAANSSPYQLQAHPTYIDNPRTSSLAFASRLLPEEFPLPPTTTGRSASSTVLNMSPPAPHLSPDQGKVHRYINAGAVTVPAAPSGAPPPPPPVCPRLTMVSPLASSRYVHMSVSTKQSSVPVYTTTSTLPSVSTQPEDYYYNIKAFSNSVSHEELGYHNCYDDGVVKQFGSPVNQRSAHHIRPSAFSNEVVLPTKKRDNYNRLSSSTDDDNESWHSSRSAYSSTTSLDQCIAPKPAQSSSDVVNYLTLDLQEPPEGPPINPDLNELGRLGSTHGSGSTIYGDIDWFRTHALNDMRRQLETHRHHSASSTNSSIRGGTK